MLTENQKSIVKATIPVLRDHGITLTSHFYQRMFAEHPELKQVFNHGHQEAGKQQHALAGAVLAYAQNIDNPSVLKSTLVHIAHKHVSLGIRAEHYFIVGKHLLASIKEVLGDQATDKLIDAWAKAYQQLADILIGMETKLYNDLAIDGAWTGWRSFETVGKIVETDQVTSFYLKPIDHGKVPDFHPGQYISVRVYVPEWDLVQIRQYTLSDSPGKDTYRISVKRWDAYAQNPAGYVSNVLHKNYNVGDRIDLAPPGGEFFLDEKSHKPVFFISAGVGITPMISMLTYLSEQQTQRSVYFIHGTRNSKTYAMHDLINAIVKKNDHIKKIDFYSAPETHDQHYAYVGRVDLLTVREYIIPDGQYYLCGPVAFMKEQIKNLKKLGVLKENIFAEAFETGFLNVEN